MYRVQKQLCKVDHIMVRNAKQIDYNLQNGFTYQVLYDLWMNKWIESKD